MKSINLKKVLYGLALAFLILTGLCLALGLINGILRKSWDVFLIGLWGLALIGIIGIIYGIVELVVRRFTIQRTLDTIFRTSDPIPLKWWRMESFLIAYRAKSIKGKESRVRFELNGAIVTFHRSHSQKEAYPYQVKDARRFLEEQR